MAIALAVIIISIAVLSCASAVMACCPDRVGDYLREEEVEG